MRATRDIQFAPGVIDGVCASLRSLEQVLERPLDVTEIVDSFPIVDGDLGLFATCRATDKGLTLEPSNRFLDLVFALRAIDADRYVVEVPSHGWLILSAAGCHPTVVEREAPASSGDRA